MATQAQRVAMAEIVVTRLMNATKNKALYEVGYQAFRRAMDLTSTTHDRICAVTAPGPERERLILATLENLRDFAEATAAFHRGPPSAS